jgi:hypothetical protein
VHLVRNLEFDPSVLFLSGGVAGFACSLGVAASVNAATRRAVTAAA